MASSWFIVESPGRKPDWLGDKRQLEIRKLYTPSNSNFSYILLHRQRREIGRYIDLSWRLFFLCTGWTLAYFQEEGKSPVSKDFLKIRYRGLATSSGHILSIEADIPSKPLAFCYQNHDFDNVRMCESDVMQWVTGEWWESRQWGINIKWATLRCKIAIEYGCIFLKVWYI